MTSCINVRTFFALSLVLILHTGIILVFSFKKSFHASSAKPLLLQFVSVIEPAAVAPRPRTGKITSPSSSEQKDRQITSSNADTPPISDASNAIHPEQPPLNLDTIRAGAVQHELNRKRSAIELQNEKNLVIEVWKRTWKWARNVRSALTVELHTRAPACWHLCLLRRDLG